jgi:hypothetical protein
MFLPDSKKLRGVAKSSETTKEKKKEHRNYMK